MMLPIWIHKDNFNTVTLILPKKEKYPKVKDDKIYYT